MDPTYKSYEAFVFDLDGVVWLGSIPIPGVAQTINTLRENGKKIRFLTNNACDHREKQFQKLLDQGIKASIEEVFTAGYASAKYVLENYGKTKVHVMGSEDLKREMTDVGHTIVEQNAEVVVTGFDRGFSWETLNQAFQNVIVDGAAIIASNPDVSYPKDGVILPGAGASLAALTTACGKDPDAIVGKPNPKIFSMVIADLGIPAENCLMTGDRLDTDVIGAQKIEMATSLALSGVCKREDIERLGIKPDHVVESVADYKRS